MKPEYRFAAANTVSDEFIQRALAEWMKHLVERAEQRRREKEATVAATANGTHP